MVFYSVMTVIHPFYERSTDPCYNVDVMYLKDIMLSKKPETLKDK